MSSPMKLKLQHVTVRKNRDGSLRYYFLRRGQPLQRLPDDPLSPEFMADYKKHLESLSPSIRAYEGTFAWLCDQYMDTSAFRSLAPATRTARTRILLSVIAEPLAPGSNETFGDEKAINIGHAHLRVLRDRKEAFPNAANERLKILSQVFKMAFSRGFVTSNPVRDIERIKSRSGGHETATDEQIDQYFAYHTEGTAWLAMRLLTEFGMRVSDLRRVGRQNIKSGNLVFTAFKNGAVCDLPISAETLPVLTGINRMTFLHSDAGRPFISDKSMSQRVSKWFSQAGVEGVAAHSVRKWLAAKKAEQGWTENELMAWFGWKTSKEAQTYTAKANRSILTASATRRTGSVTRG